MIRSISVTNHNREFLLMDLFHPEYTGLNITNIDGLGPARAQINIADMASVDGGLFSSARLNTRNIVFTFMLMMEPTVEDVRLKIYRYFPIKKKVSLRFTTDTRVSEIEGYVESVTPEIFQEKETCQVSIICPDPNFYASGGTGTVFSGVEPLFEFPFPAEEYFSGDPATLDTIPFGEISFETTVSFTYYGDVDTGMLITIHAKGEAENITLWNNDTREHITIDTTKIYQITNIRYGLSDDILISTKKGNRYVRLLHQGVYYDILGAVNRDADFFQLTSGLNTFSFQADDGESNLTVSFEYRNAYGGI